MSPTSTTTLAKLAMTLLTKRAMTYSNSSTSISLTSSSTGVRSTQSASPRIPKAHTLTQIVSAYGDYLGEYLLQLVATDRSAFIVIGVGETRRSRLSPLAAQD